MALFWFTVIDTTFHTQNLDSVFKTKQKHTSTTFHVNNCKQFSESIYVTLRYDYS